MWFDLDHGAEEWDSGFLWNPNFAFSSKHTCRLACYKCTLAHDEIASLSNLWPLVMRVSATPESIHQQSLPWIWDSQSGWNWSFPKWSCSCPKVGWLCEVSNTLSSNMQENSQELLKLPRRQNSSSHCIPFLSLLNTVFRNYSRPGFLLPFYIVCKVSSLSYC